MLDSSAVARGVSVGTGASSGAPPPSVTVMPVQSMLPPTLSVQGTANTGDNVSVSATTSDADGFTTTGVTLLNGASVVGSMTNGGGGNWTFTMSSVSAGTYVLTARRTTVSGTADSDPRVLVVSSPGVVGTLQANLATPTQVLQDDLASGNVQIRTS